MRSANASAQWIELFCISFALTLVPTCSRAQDPYTVVQTIAGVVGAISGLSGSEATKRWQSEASSKLDKIIEQNNTTIVELRDLKIFIPEELEKKFNEEVAITSISLSRRFDQYMSGKTPDKPSIRMVRGDVEQTVYNLGERGPSVYQAAGATTTLALAIYKVLGSEVPKEQRAKLLDTIIAKMERWASNENGMFGASIAEQDRNVSEARAELAGFPTGHVSIFSQRTSYDAGTRPNTDIPRTVQCTLDLSADVQIDTTKFTQSVSNPVSEGCSGNTWFTSDFGNQKAAEHASRIQTVLNRLSVASKKLTALNAHKDALQKIIAGLKAAS